MSRCVGAETVREPDGLALSSRNRYLDAEQRHQAVALSRALRVARAAAANGVRPRWPPRTPSCVARQASTSTTSRPRPRPRELPADVPPGTEARILIAAKVGSTRLIDNLP